TYDAGSNRIVLHDLERNTVLPMDVGSHAGFWIPSPDGPRFLYATEKQLLIHNPASDQRHVLSEGPLIPLWCHPQARSFLLLAPGQQDWTFELVKLRLAPPR